MMGLVGTCELALCAGVPVLQAYALALIRNSHGKVAKEEHLAGSGLEYRLKAEFGTTNISEIKARAMPVTDLARLDFEEAFDTPIWEQIAI